MHKNLTGMVLLAIVTLVAPGCLTKETNHTIYLEPNGTVTWTVLERDVRSDGGPDGARSREEAEYFSAASEGRFPVSLALASLDPISVRLGILRAVPPYAVFTDARFARLDSLMARLIEKLGMRGTSTLERHSGMITWTLTVDDVGKPAGSEGSDEGIEALLDGFGKTCRWVLVEGRFVDAFGFDLSEDHRIATPDDSDVMSEPWHVSLTWTERRN